MTPSTSDEILAAALEFAAYGWKVVPLYGVVAGGKCNCSNADDCPNPGKHPRGNDWQKLATSDEETIIQRWEKRPASNVGVLLGPQSGIIDIECDTPGAEELLSRIFGGEFPVTPTFQSRRGKHRLFKFSERLPYLEKASFKVGQIDVKTGGGKKGTQSVFPPSNRMDGGKHEWLIHPSESPLAEISDQICAQLANSAGEDIWRKEKEQSPRLQLYTDQGVGKGGRDDAIYRDACAQWREKYALHGSRCLSDDDKFGEVFERCRGLHALNVMKGNSPLEGGDDAIRERVESARRFITKQVELEKDADSSKKLTRFGLEWREGEWFPGNWQLYVIDSDPVTYKLHVPAFGEFTHANSGDIFLTLNQLVDHGAFSEAVLSQTKVVILDDRPGWWSGVWNGKRGVKDKSPATRGLKAKLMDLRKHVKASPDEKRYVDVAEYLAKMIEKAGTEHENGDPDATKFVVRMGNGEVWLQWREAWKEHLECKRVEQSELNRMRRLLGIDDANVRRWPQRPQPGVSRKRYIALTVDNLETLRKMREIDED